MSEHIKSGPSDEALCSRLQLEAELTGDPLLKQASKRLAELAAEVARLSERADGNYASYERIKAKYEQSELDRHEAESLAAATFERTKQRAAEVCDERMRLMTDARGEVREHVIADRFLARAGEAMQCATAIRNLPPAEPRNG